MGPPAPSLMGGAAYGQGGPSVTGSNGRSASQNDKLQQNGIFLCKGMFFSTYAAGFTNGKRRQCQLTLSPIAACLARSTPISSQPQIEVPVVKDLKLLAMINILKDLYNECSRMNTVKHCECLPAQT